MPFDSFTDDSQAQAIPLAASAVCLGEINLVDLIDQPAWKTILLDLVRSEKMDPWNIDILVLTDKYLAKISALENANLRIPANAILACAILLKTKSKALSIASLEEQDEEFRGLTPEERRLLEASLPELAGTRKAPEAKISLDELVNTIENILRKSKSKQRYANLFEEVTFAVPFSEFDLEKRMVEVLELVHDKADSQGIVMFSQLINGTKDPLQIIQVFIPVLFLANKGKLTVWQEEFWKEIFISLQETPLATQDNQPEGK